VQSSPPPQQPTQQTATNTTQPTPQPAVNPPMPQATTPNTKWSIYKDPSGACFSAYQIECKPNVSCNPPRPQPYTCPTNVDLTQPVTIVSSADGMSCQVDWGPISCRAGATCNPPPPKQMTCPAP
jgi:hypothetical protein